MEDTVAFAGAERERAKEGSGEGRRGDGNPGPFTPYHAPWFGSSAWGALLCAAYPLLVLTPLAVFATASPSAHRALIAEMGVDCAVVAFTILALQFVMAARLRWIEAPFGLDAVLRFHRTMAFVAMGLLCLHPLFVASGEGWALLTRWQAHWPVWAGRLALLLLFAHASAAVFRRMLRLRYETWRRLHNTAAFLLLGLAFFHSWMLGDDFMPALPGGVAPGRQPAAGPPSLTLLREETEESHGPLFACGCVSRPGRRGPGRG